ncbi:monovalent cation/H(+) antiporter subunit G [Rhizobium sp. EC-SD404]|uniref:monovalent cation/H(+) antiporter subunit G n=1 Tax=Rhizobium sp. EC-SD404 TaxID=2038389 RepID=UPI00125A5142|nr:monovalent cation/H(+) antiporter subunit G [Rhizobium sp. EC-SD404]VVT24329.1 putative K(+)/H(+) antiporter subunit G [Rhizobium sp. EC-SD404]
MTVDLVEYPLWAAILVSCFLVVGSLLTLIGAIGMVRLKSFYDRIHAPTLATSWGTGGMAVGSMIFFLVGGGRPLVHELLLAAFVTITTPVTLMMLGRAAIYRDRSSARPGIPPVGRRADLNLSEEPREGEVT